ncbi:MAG: hypothetical protein V2I27_10605 [Erythrobacter sp.]|jgi:hypothetical protein|nr:hypothetical protein [Erythrobacter sp.]
MTAVPIHSSQPDRWSSPRPYSDASIRLLKHGRVRPMEEPGFFERLFLRR